MKIYLTADEVKKIHLTVDEVKQLIQAGIHEILGDTYEMLGDTYGRCRSIEFVFHSDGAVDLTVNTPGRNLDGTIRK